MTTLNSFIKTNNIRPADAIVMKKKSFGMLDHYVIYLGVQNGRYQFVANYSDGVKLIPDYELVWFLGFLSPSAIDRFPGTEAGRYIALARAKSKIGEKAYHLISNNCQHFKNWVHYGIESSEQVESAGKAMMLGGLAMTAVGASNKNETLTWIGGITAFLGAVFTAIENDKRK